MKQRVAVMSHHIAAILMKILTIIYQTLVYQLLDIIYDAI